MVNYFPLVSSIISVIFAILLLAQYVQRRKKHQLIWTIALTMFFLTTLFEFLAEPEVFGGIFPFFGGLEARFGGETFFFAFETIGTILLFLGFLLSREYIKKRTELRKERS